MALFPKLAEWQIVQNFLRLIDPLYASPVAREERRQQQIGNPREDSIKREHLGRQEALYARGFPVAGHGEPEPPNNPRPRQRPKLTP
jgi:hypothetical protein